MSDIEIIEKLVILVLGLLIRFIERKKMLRKFEAEKAKLNGSHNLHRVS